jgi:hypothetical protein
MSIRTRTTVLVLMVGVLVLIAGSEWYRVFGWSAIALKVVVAAAVPVAIALTMGQRPNKGPVLPSILSLVVLLWFLAVAVQHTSILWIIPTPATLTGVYNGIISGWSQILSVPLVVTGPADMLVLPCVVVWIAALVGAEIVQRTRYPLAGVLPPLAALVFALFFGIGGGGPRVIPVVGFVVVGLLFAGFTARPVVESTGDDHRRVITRRAIEIAVCTALAAVIAAVVGPSMPLISSGHPYNPRANRIPPTNPVQAISPLAQLSAWALAKPKVLFTVTTSGSVPPTFRLADLSSYDNLNGWTDRSSFERIGQSVPTPTAELNPDKGGPTRVVDQQYSIKALPGPWLPTQLHPVEIKDVDALSDIQTGVVVAASGTAHGTRYTVRSTVPTDAPNCATDDVVASSHLVLPSEVEQMAQRLTQGAATPCEQAEDLNSALRNTTLFTFDATASTGTNIQVMENFMYGSGSGAKRGTSEQFASAFALLAESLGLPARVYVGFHSGTQVGPHQWQVTTHDAYAGADIDFAGLGWVAFDPTRLPGKASPPPDERDKQHSSIVTSPTPAGPQKIVQGPVKRAQAPPQASVVTIVVTLVGLAIAGVLVILGVLAGVVAFVRRRRSQSRRHAAEARERLLGAWLESVDHISDLGVRPDSSRTTRELVAVGAERLGEDSANGLDPLASMVNAATFSSWEPDDQSASEAWGIADSVGESTGVVLGRRGRFLRAIDIRIVFKRGRP